VRRTRIKICGITRPEDAAVAAEAGADAIGILLHRTSKRFTPLPVAAQIIRAVGPMVTTVGVFVDAEIDGVKRASNILHLHHLQLHGSETPAFVLQLCDYDVVKTIRVDPKTIRGELQRWRDPGLSNLRGILLETATHEAGGTGIENDWQEIATLIAEKAFDGLPPIIAAGGLTPQNVGNVVKRLRPWAVDVSSGVESSIGEKSPEKIKAFIAEVRAADAQAQ
jgi:phosphoribosylanthranilate isomerase